MQIKPMFLVENGEKNENVTFLIFYTIQRIDTVCAKDPSIEEAFAVFQ